MDPTKKKAYHNFYSVASILLFIISSHFTIASPVIRSSRMVREIYPEVDQEIPDSSQIQVCIVGDVVYGPGEGVPSEKPCLKCACAPPGLHCETEKCIQQPGCRTIHRPNKCCPDYQCECQHEGRSYANGERLLSTPGGECLVCYCRGGEVQCSEVGCYTRSDCEARYVIGECCPKYDHCPPREHTSDRLPNQPQEATLSSIDAEVISSLPITGVPENATTLESVEGSGEPEEHLSPTPTLITTPNPIQGDEPKRSSTHITFSIKDYDSKTKKLEVIPKIDKATQTDSEGRPQITIQEVIPELTEFKSPQQKDVPNRAVSLSPINPVTYKHLDSSTTNPNDNDVESYASEKTEVYDHPPPVLRIGDQLLFIKQGQLVPEKDASTPSPVITLIGAEGLQIGLGSGELLDHEIIPVNREEVSTNNPVAKRLDPNGSKSTESTTADSRESTPEVISSEDSSDLETASNDSVLTSNEFILADMEITDYKSEELSSTEASVVVTSEDASSEKTSSEKTSSERSSTDAQVSSTTDRSDYVPEENPYYPAIPEDIMNVQEESSTESTHLTKSTTPTSTEYISPSSLSTESADPSSESSESSQTESTVLSVRDTPKIRLLLYAKSSDEVTDKIFVTPLPSATKQDDSEVANTDIEEDLTVEGLKKRVQDSKEDISKTIKEEGEVIQRDTHDKSNAEKILPEVLEVRSNTSIKENGTQEWLKENPTKISIPLTKDSNLNIPENITELKEANIQNPETVDSELSMQNSNHKSEESLVNIEAALPDSILKQIAPSDLIENDNVTHEHSETFENSSENNSDESTSLKSLPTRTLLQNSMSSESVESSTQPAEDLAATDGMLSTKVVEVVISAKDLVNPTDITNEELNSEEDLKSSEEIMKVAKEAQTPTSQEEMVVISKEIATNKEEMPAKIVIPSKLEAQSSKETLEMNDELFSDESTTIKSSPIETLSNDDASIEIIQNDSLDLSDAVEMLPGFQKSTPIIFKSSEEQLRDQPSPKDDVEIISADNSNVQTHAEFKSPTDERQMLTDSKKNILQSPKEQLEIATANTFKEQSKTVPFPKDEVQMMHDPNIHTNEEFKDFHEEIQKRDVVKKVLKDTFENPKENIRTDLVGATEDPELDPTNQDGFNEEVNAVKPIEFHDLSTRSLNPQIYNSSLSNKVAPNKLNADVRNKNLDETEVIQKVKNDHSKVQESTETLDTGALGVLRDFFQTQFRHYQDSRSSD